MANFAGLHVRVIATTLLLGVGVAMAAACGPGSRGPAAPVGSVPPASSSAALAPAEPADATPVHVEFVEGGCSVVADDSPGSSYKTSPGQQAGAAEALAPALKACFAAGTGRQGLLHVRAAVRADGTLADAMAAPGGALSNEVESCVAKGMAKVRLPAPQSADAVLLLLLTSTCPER